MDRVISPEERMRRAEEIYYRRKAQGVRVSTTSVNLGRTQKVSLGKKMVIQILICATIYSIFLILKNHNSIFSENVINGTKEVLSYDINFPKLYNQGMEYFKGNFNNIVKVNGVIEENQNEKSDVERQEENQENNDSNQTENNEESQTEQTNPDKTDDHNQEVNDNEKNENNLNEGNQNDATNQEGIGGGTDISQITGNDGTVQAKMDAENKTQMEQDAEFIKQNCNLILPAQGKVTSVFGAREETEIISAFHQGIDIGVPTGTAIQAAMDGTVVAASYAGDYGNHIKIQNGEVLTVYAHCSQIEVNIGEQVHQGQEIGKTGATGNVTGPHLHFEIRREGRYVDPQMILNF